MAQQPTGGRGHVVDEATRAELKRVAVLFIVSSITLLLFLVYVLAAGLGVTFIPPIVWAMWGASMLSGSVATWVYGTFVTIRARRWYWVALCVVPFTAVPCSVAYAWIRRGEIEVEIAAPRERSAH